MELLNDINCFRPFDVVKNISSPQGLLKSTLRGQNFRLRRVS